jgi:hypothetical protein
MNYKKIFFITICTKLILIGCTRNITTNTSSQLSSYLTLKQAFDLSYKLALKEDSNPRIILINSVDDGTQSGLHGEKKHWNVIFSLPSKKKKLLVFIQYGKVAHTMIIDYLYEDSMAIKDLQIDSKDLIKPSQKYNIKPGTGVPFSGYQYQLMVDSKRSYISIKGFNLKNESLVIFYNPTNGKYLGRIDSN